MERLSFAGHETFHCRNYWLKKGVDHVMDGQKFDNSAIINLGVGKNMVTSIRFWLKAFNLTDENDTLNDLAIKLFDTEEGLDPYCEDIATVWLLHFSLVTHKRASIYHLVFNEFRRHRVEFTREQLLAYLERFCKRNDYNYNRNSLKKDITVFLSNYTISSKSQGVEDDFSGLLYELDLVHTMEKSGGWYRIENAVRNDLPYQVVLFCILSNMTGSSISFNELLNDTDSVGSVFALTANGLMEKIQEMLDAFPKDIVFSDDGGVRVLQFKNQLDGWKILKSYYAS